jgi:hypothetical protein
VSTHATFQGTPPLHGWRISLIKGTPATTIGNVEAADAESAIKKAIVEFDIKTRKSNGGSLRSCIVDRANVRQLREAATPAEPQLIALSDRQMRSPPIEQ